MRNYSCYVYHKSDKGYIRNSNVACWLGIKNYVKGTTVYISDFDEPDTHQYQDLLVGVINQITPCEIIKRSGKVFYSVTTYDYVKNEQVVHVTEATAQVDKFIKFKLLGSYAQSLVLLNFIRNLWFTSPHVIEYSVNLFRALETTVETDPLRRLCIANKSACSNAGHFYGGDHSNVYSSTKIKSVEELLEYDGMSVREFLT